jgi:hypothetical protein
MAENLSLKFHISLWSPWQRAVGIYASMMGLRVDS